MAQRRFLESRRIAPVPRHTTRGTSWFGTATFGVVLALTDSYRPAIFALIVFFAIGGILLLRVDTARGIREAGNAAPSTI